MGYARCKGALIWVGVCHQKFHYCNVRGGRGIQVGIKGRQGPLRTMLLKQCNNKVMFCSHIHVQACTHFLGLGTTVSQPQACPWLVLVPTRPNTLSGIYPLVTIVTSTQSCFNYNVNPSSVVFISVTA